MVAGSRRRCVPIAYLGGIAARSERYMRDHWGFAKGFVDAQALLASARQEEADHVAAQQAAGLDLLAPALTRWEDLFRPFERDGSGVTTGQVFRYFETNTFFRQPLVTGPFPTADPQAAFEAFAIPKGKGWVLTLPSPWDFACRSKDERAGRSTADLALEVAAGLKPAVDAAFKAGAKLVRFHDPSIAYARAAQRDVDAFADALAVAANGHEADCTVHITNGDPFNVPEALLANPLGGLSIEDPGRAPPRGLKLPSRARLTLALLRGEDSIVEDPALLAARALELANTLGLDVWGLTNGWDLDHVPHAIALRKVAILGQARTALKEVLA
jgi:methionine synthase II (cobalamin-independent)